MMNFIVSSSYLLKQLQVLGSVINSNNTLPILDNFLFELDNNQLHVSASDLETTMLASLEIESNSKGSVAIPAKLLLDIWLSLLNPLPRQIQSTYVPPLESPREIARVQLALTYISADCDYETYRNVVWALMSTGWANAIDLARNWCMTCMDRYREHGFELVVESYDSLREPRISLGTLFKLAKEGGFNA
jgi:hypothetical protein